MSKLVNEGGYWRIQYYDPGEGRTRRLTTKLKATRDNKTEANKIRKSFDADFEARTNPENYNSLKGFTIFTKALEGFFASRNLAENTRDLVNYSAKYLVAACGDKAICLYRLEDVNAKLDAYFEKRKLSDTSQSIYRDHLHSVFAYFLGKKFTKENPIKTIPKKKTIVVTIPDEHQALILEELKTHTQYPNQYRAVFFMFATGARISDACALQRKHIHFDENMIIMTNKKRDRQYEFPLTNDLKEMFLSYDRGLDEKEFGYKDRSSFHFFHRACYKLKDSNGQPLPLYGFHKIRKTFNTRLWKLGVSVEDRTKLLNQTSMSTNQKSYTSYDNFERLKRLLESDNEKSDLELVAETNRGLNGNEIEQFKVLLEKFLDSGALKNPQNG